MKKAFIILAMITGILTGYSAIGYIESEPSDLELEALQTTELVAAKIIEEDDFGGEHFLKTRAYQAFALERGLNLSDEEIAALDWAVTETVSKYSF